MPKCKKTKNPCKICLGQVSEKTGIQCQGACRTWIHFECLNYTPGKVKDIKAGIIKVTCPCPDCKTTQPKEYRTDEPFSCRNMQCPANVARKCDNTGCPTNKGRGNMEPDPRQTCALDKCGTGCKTNSTPHLPGTPAPQPITPCLPQQHPLPYPVTSSDNCLDFNECPSGCSSSSDIPGDYGQNDGAIMSMGTLETMCNTLGQLTNQINNLMQKMKKGVEKNDYGNRRSPQSVSRSVCPKPCFCPGNPGRR